MRCFLFLAMFGLIFQPTCAHQYFVKIQPATEGEVYKVQVGDIVTFELSVFEKTEKSDVPANIEIDKTFWNFDKRLLEKVYSDNYSLQLKAVKVGTAGLEITTFIQNSQDSKNLTILITE